MPRINLISILAALLLSQSIFTISCSNANIKKIPENIRFAVIGNTKPGDPYSGPGFKLENTIERINIENPLFVIHLGDMICGGIRWLGVKKNDIENQYLSQYSLLSRLNPILYTVKGEKDIFKGASDIYTNFTERNVYYSFNYGNIHFIVIDSTDPGLGEISTKQKIWIERDLKKHKYSSAIFIFSHYPVFYSAGKNPGSKITCKDAKSLHEIFFRYPVKAVISGHYTFYHKEKRDDITYIIAGCTNYDKRFLQRKKFQYYIIEYFNDKINIRAKKI